MSNSCDEICSILKESYNDFVVDTKDYISFSTIIEMYLSTPCRFSDRENLKIITTLFDLIKNNVELLNEIGWDLPELLLKYVPNKVFSFSEGLGRHPKIFAVFNVFNVLVEKGNPKELFLKSCELLSTIGFNDDARYFELFWGSDMARVNDDTKEKYLDLKFHLLFEMNTGCFRKIRTIYPSKFLSMKISSTIKFLHNNCVFFNNPIFVMRRIYVFARDYSQPPKPADYDLKDLSNVKIQEDDEYLQGKLLQHFLTDSIEISLKYYQTDLVTNFHDYLLKYLDESYTFNKAAGFEKYSASDFKDIISKNHYYRITNNGVTVSEFTEFFNRFYQLSLSFDIDTCEILHNMLVDDTKSLYTNATSSMHDATDDMKIMRIFQITNDSFFKLMTGIDNDDKAAIGKIPLSPLGCFLIYSSHLLDNVVVAMDNNKEIAVDKRSTFISSIEDLVFVSLRLLIPVLSINERISIENVRSPPTYFMALWKKILNERKQNNGDNKKLVMDYDELDAIIPLDLNTMESEELIELEKNVEDNAGLIYYCYWNRNFKLNSQNYFPYLQDLVIFINLSFYRNVGFDKLKESTSQGSKLCFFIRIYLQCFLSIIAKQRKEDICKAKKKKLILDYLTAFLRYCDEEFAWKFIMESLKSCPYLSVKIDLIKVVKTLGSETKSPKSLEKTLQSLSIKTNFEKENAKPELPPRGKSYYLSLNKSRRTEILGLITETMDDIFDADPEKKIRDGLQDHLSTLSQAYQLLLTYLNLVYSLNHFFEKSELSELHNAIDAKLKDEVDVNNNSNLLRLFNLQMEKLIQ